MNPMKSNMQRRSFVLLALAAFAAGCDRWQPLQPKTLYYRDPFVAFDSAFATLKTLEYEFVRLSRPHFFVEVESKRHSGSFITMQIYGDARMIVRAYGGRLVRGNTIHKALAREIDNLISAFRASGHVVR